MGVGSKWHHILFILSRARIQRPLLFLYMDSKQPARLQIK